MNKLISFLRLIRINNILIMLATQVLAYYCLTDYLLAEDLLSKRFLFLVLATLLTGTAGYIINDYHDVKLDMINKPEEVVIGNHISRRWAMLLHLWFNGFAVLFALAINKHVAIAVILCVITLWFYSTYFKRQFLSGNIIVAGLSAFVILIIKYFDRHSSSLLVFSYASFAFVISLLREIVKDAEDLHGDSKFDCKTLPIVLGIRKTKKVLIYINIIFAGLLFCYLFIALQQLPKPHSYTHIAYILYMILLVIIPLLGITYLLIKADTKKDFGRLSSLYKLVMLTGMLSMILLKV